MEQLTLSSAQAVTVSMACVVEWIEQERALHRRQARKLKDAELRVLGAYFGPVLDDLRVRIVRTVELPRWAWSRTARVPRAQPVPAVALIDTIVISERALSPSRPLLSILFQGCVRAELYRLYGVEGFVEAYIDEYRSDGPARECVSFGVISQALLDSFEQGARPFDVHAVLWEALYEPLRPVTHKHTRCMRDDALADPTALRRGVWRAQR